MTRDLLVDLLLLSAIVPLVISIVLYVRVPWYKTALGLFFMGYHISMLTIWILILLLRHNVGLTLLSNLALVVFIVVSIFLWWGTFLMFRYTVKERHRLDVLEEGREG